MKAQTIHPQLLSDCHLLGEFPSGSLLLHRNSGLPWFILVPRTDQADVLDLEAREREQVMTDCAAISAFIKEQLDYPKVNFAGLGNQVPQMHLHIIGRRPGDCCWPNPVWGQLPSGEAYASEQLQQWQRALADSVGLIPGVSP